MRFQYSIQKYFPHFQMTQSSLQLKLQLLRTIKQGNIDQIHSLVANLQKSTKINPQLYAKFNDFISENKKGLLEMQKEQKQQIKQPKITIENYEGELDDDYNSDDSWTSQSSQSQEQQKEIEDQRNLFEQISNKPKEQIRTSASSNKRKDKNTLNNPQTAFKKNILKPNTSSQCQARNIKTKY